MNNIIKKYVKLLIESAGTGWEELDFIISELKTAFQIGFLLYIPFIVLDMVVASVLMAMGMMMLPPMLVSMPFKLLLFVLVDGWQLVTGAILRSFNT